MKYYKYKGPSLKSTKFPIIIGCNTSASEEYWRLVVNTYLLISFDDVVNEWFEEIEHCDELPVVLSKNAMTIDELKENPITPEDNKKNTLTINLFAGPGVGKTTTAAYLFAELKKAGIDCELISEYAKTLVYESAHDKLRQQIYIFAKQHRKHVILDGKVDVVITDSPFPLGFYYDQGNTAFLKEMIMSEFNKLNSMNFFLVKMHDTYNPNGRTQTKEQADTVHMDIEQLLIDNNILYDCMYVPHDENMQTVVQHIIDRVKNKSNR